MAVEGALKIEDRILNDCKLTDYLDINKFTHFNSLLIKTERCYWSNPRTIIRKSLQLPWSNNIVCYLLDCLFVLYFQQSYDRPEIVTENVSFVNCIWCDKVKIHLRINLKRLINLFFFYIQQNVSGTIKYVNGMEIDRVEHAGHLNVSTWNGKDVHNIM